MGFRYHFFIESSRLVGGRVIIIRGRNLYLRVLAFPKCIGIEDMLGIKIGIFDPPPHISDGGE